MCNKKHTQGEWKVGGKTKSLQGLYIHADGKQLATIFTSVYEGEENAKLIVKAVNNHEKLIEALKDFVYNAKPDWDRANKLLQSIKQQ